MAGVSRRGGTGGVSGEVVVNDNDDEEEDEVLLVPPRFSGNHLTVTWPIKCPVECMVGNCKRSLKVIIDILL